MIIEIRGAQTVNKGAELMLLSVIQEVNKRCRKKDITFVVEPNSNTEYHKRIEYGLLAIPRYRRRRINWGTITKYLPKRIRNDFGIVTENEVDLVIDISGFRYGDYWGTAGMIAGITSYIKQWKKKEIKVILLPQAFGPFENKGMEGHAIKILKYADLVCARDKDSYSYLQEVHTNFEKNNLYLYPDFTPSISVDGEVEKYNDQILIIPNSKMLGKDSSYIDYLINLVLYLKKNEKKFCFLIHEGESDYEIAKKVVEKSEVEIEIIWEKNPLKVKKIIKSSFLLITSRFHGLINGLSQGVPTISTSWSHKYERVLEEYDFKNLGLVKDLKDFNKTVEKIDHIIENYEAVKESIEEKSKDHKNMIEKMWDKVIEIIESS